MLKTMLQYLFIFLLMTHVQSVPVFDANGPTEDGIDYITMFIEDTDTNISILPSDAFINDQGSSIVLATIEITNPVRPVRNEHLYITHLPTSLLSIEGNGSYMINISSTGPASSISEFERTIRSVRYLNNATEPSSVNRVVEFTVFDGVQTNTTSATTTIDIQTIDDVPIADLNGATIGVNGRQTYGESSPPMLILSDLDLIDPDSYTSITGAQARIDTVFDVGNESIAFDPALLPSGVTCQPASCNGTSINIVGTSTVPSYQRFLATLQYVNLQQSVDLPNLRDRLVNVTVSDRVSTSDSNVHVLIDFIPVNPRVIIELAAPNQNFETTFEEDQLSPIPCTSNIRVVDTSIQTLESIVISIRDNLPAGVEEDLEMITVTSVTGLDISIEINTVLKRITISQVAPVSQYVDAIQRVRYFNGENEPYQINRFVDFLIIPGGGAPNDTAFCNITIIPNTIKHCEPTSSIFQRCRDANTLAKRLVNVSFSSHEIQEDELLSLINVIEYLSPLANIEENNEIRENFLDAVDNLIQVNSTVGNRNASERLLDVLVGFADNVQLPITTNSKMYIQTAFTVRVNDINSDQFNGGAFTVNTVSFEQSENSLSTRIDHVETENFQNVTQDQNVIAAVKIPPTIFEELGSNGSNASNLQRVSISSFAQRSLFPLTKKPSNVKNLTLILSSNIVAVRVNASTENTQLSDPIEVHFQLSDELINSTLDLLCGVWKGSQEGWSFDSCTLIIQNEMTAVAKYHQLGHFALLLAVEEDPLPTALSFTLYTVTIVGIALSLLCLILFLITFPTIKKLRNSDHGGILVNMCIALMCVYVTYLIAAHASPVRTLCITAAALLQYSFLVFFGWTTAEALYLYRNLVVKILGTKIKKFALKVGIVVWVLPLVIVAVSIGPGFDFYYTDDHSFCRARGLPFWLGFILPFLIIYTINWILFFLIMVSLCRRKSTRPKKKLLKENAIIAVGLAVLFGLGWGFGLAVSSTGDSTVNFVLQLVFVIFVGCQGVLIFALHGIKRADFRKKWKEWFYKITGRPPHSLVKPVTGGLESRSTHHIALKGHELKTCTTESKMGSFDELESQHPDGVNEFEDSDSIPPKQQTYEL